MDLIEQIEVVIENKANLFMSLSDKPFILVLFCVTLLIIIVAIVIIVISKTNPNFGNKLLELRKQINDNKILEEENNAILKTLSERETKLEEMFTSDREERKTRQLEVDEQFNYIKSEIKNIYGILDDHAALANKLSRGTLEGHVFDDGYPIFRRLKSFRRGIAKRINGRFLETGLKLIRQNPETWKDVEETELDIEIDDRDYWNNVMADIKRMLK
jgi:hypothetical protein